MSLGLTLFVFISSPWYFQGEEGVVNFLSQPFPEREKCCSRASQPPGFVMMLVNVRSVQNKIYFVHDLIVDERADLACMPMSEGQGKGVTIIHKAVYWIVFHCCGLMIRTNYFKNSCPFTFQSTFTSYSYP